jgi:hypothetical protein
MGQFLKLSKLANLSAFYVLSEESRWREVAEGGVKYTKSSLKLGQEMHKGYKLGTIGIKEFRLPSGKRIDLLDINSTIFELKPFNPRAMKAEENQLKIYMKEMNSPAVLQKYPEFNGIN